VCVLLSCGSLALASVACESQPSAQTPSSGRGRGGRGGGGDAGGVPVVTAAVGRQDVPVDIAAIGNVEAFEAVSLRAQVTGTVTGVFFHEGDSVKKGDKVFEIDARPFQAQLEQARANLTRDQALLAQAEAQLARDSAQATYFQITAQRSEDLTERGIVAKDTAQQSRAASDAANATVNADKASIASAKAQLVAQQAVVDNARVQLEYTVVRAPIAGRTGNIPIKLGGLVTANTTELATIAVIEPVYVTFSVPALHLSAIEAEMRKAPLTVTATPQDSEDSPSTGRLSFIDNSVDASTDTIRLKAEFANADRGLWPGEFARVALRLKTLPGATVVPSQAVQTGQDGQFVFVVKPDATVEQRTIKAGQKVNQDIVIDSGLTPGETVVTEGQLRLEAGARVQPQGAADSGGAGRGRGGRGRGGRASQ
jgi:multidrug efflux system membrane fusion protein